MARPKVEIDWKVVDELCKIDCSKIYIAMRVGVTPKTLDNQIKQEHDMTWTEYKNIQLQETVKALKAKAISLALKGREKMLMYVLSNIGDWNMLGRPEEKLNSYRRPEGLIDDRATDGSGEADSE